MNTQQQPDTPPVDTPAADTPPADGPAADGQGPFRTQPVSFVRRGGRLSTGRQRAWDDHRGDYLIEVPRGRADTSVDPEYVLDPVAEFGRPAPLTVEIGSGLGEAVVEAAAAHPERDFLAIEVYTPGIAQTIMHLAKRGLSNVRLVQANAPEALTTMLTAGSANEVWVFFPDPWHKTKHHKRRLVKDSFAPLVARVLEEGGLWRLATDWADYAAQMRDVGDAAADFENLYPGQQPSPEDPAGGYAPRFGGRVLTSFENKAQHAGRQIFDLTYRRR